MLRTNGLTVISVVNSAVNGALGPPSANESRVENTDPDESGMFGSARLGIGHALQDGVAGAVLLPVDHALVSRADVASVVSALMNGAAIALPVFEGKRGHPIGVSREVMTEILEARPDWTLRDVVHRDPTRIVEVPGSMGVVLSRFPLTNGGRAGKFTGKRGWRLARDPRAC